MTRYFDDDPARVPAAPSNIAEAWDHFARQFSGSDTSITLLRRTFFAGALAATMQTVHRQERILDEYRRELLDGEPPIGGPNNGKG